MLSGGHSTSKLKCCKEIKHNLVKEFQQIPTINIFRNELITVRKIFEVLRYLNTITGNKSSWPVGGAWVGFKISSLMDLTGNQIYILTFGNKKLTNHKSSLSSIDPFLKPSQTSNICIDTICLGPRHLARQTARGETAIFSKILRQTQAVQINITLDDSYQYRETWTEDYWDAVES